MIKPTKFKKADVIPEKKEPVMPPKEEKAEIRPNKSQFYNSNVKQNFTEQKVNEQDFLDLKTTGLIDPKPKKKIKAKRLKFGPRQP